MKRIVIKRDDGGVSIMQILEEADSTEAVRKWQTTAKEKYVSFREIEAADLPNRDFRNAWTDDLAGPQIDVDMPRAKDIHLGRIRERRKEKFEELDVEYMKALEAGDSFAQTTAKNKKQALRDAPAASAITDASNTTELKASWDTSILGVSPY